MSVGNFNGVQHDIAIGGSFIDRDRFVSCNTSRIAYFLCIDFFSLNRSSVGFVLRSRRRAGRNADNLSHLTDDKRHFTHGRYFDSGHVAAGCGSLASNVGNNRVPFFFANCRKCIAQLNANRSRVKKEEQDESLAREDVSVFPLATPLIAGPGAISTVVLLSSQSKNFYQQISLILAIVLALAANHVILKGAPILFKFLGQTGLNLITRIMGIILTAMAIQFLLNGLDGAIGMMKNL